jgi:hypothetical protein
MIGRRSASKLSHRRKSSGLYMCSTNYGGGGNEPVYVAYVRIIVIILYRSYCFGQGSFWPPPFFCPFFFLFVYFCLLPISPPPATYVGKRGRGGRLHRRALRRDADLVLAPADSTQILISTSRGLGVVLCVPYNIAYTSRARIQLRI